MLDTPKRICYNESMDATQTGPRTLVEAIKRFDDLDYCRELVASQRWPEGVRCPHCEEADPYFLKSRKIWKCRACRRQFSVKVGTIFEDSPLGLDKWLTASWMIVNSKNGVSSCEIHREIGVTQATAWFMLQRIRKAMELGNMEKLGGEIEIDETYVGGKIPNMHKHKAREAREKPNMGKTIVMGMVARGGELRTKIIPEVSAAIVMPIIQASVESPSRVFTDESPAYNDVQGQWTHQSVNHSVEYVRGVAHTNRIENFWSLLKRALNGTYTHCAPEHLRRYVAEQAFRYNKRQETNAGRFQTVLSCIAGRRLTYSELTGQEA